jgi:hypothetical protein
MSAHKDALIYPMLRDPRTIIAHKGYDGGSLYQVFVERYLAHLKSKDENCQANYQPETANAVLDGRYEGVTHGNR